MAVIFGLLTRAALTLAAQGLDDLESQRSEALAETMARLDAAKRARRLRRRRRREPARAKSPTLARRKRKAWRVALRRS